ncbi:hypothetical protein GJ496_007880, partial [Pomphorhynchus laevis]
LLLDKPANSLKVHRLRPLLESAIRLSSNHDEAGDTLFYIDIKLLTATLGDVGWDIFALDYCILDGPLITIFPKEIITNYSKVFYFLWKVKRMEFTAVKLWNALKSVSSVARQIAAYKSIMQECHLFCQIVLHFISQLNGYIMLEVLECSWQDFYQKLSTAENLDNVIRYNRDWIQTIMQQLCLSDDDQSNEHLLKNMYAAFAIILRFSQTAEKFIDLVSSKANPISNQGLKIILQKQIKEINLDFQENITQILDLTHNTSCQALKFLHFRLDFNYFYSSTKLFPGVLPDSLTCFTKSLLNAYCPTRATRRTYQVSIKPNWFRQFQREPINFCKLSRNNIELRGVHSKTSLRQAECLLRARPRKRHGYCYVEIAQMKLEFQLAIDLIIFLKFFVRCHGR